MSGAAWAQTTGGRTLPNDPEDRDHNQGKTHTLKQLQAKLNNPLSDLWSLQLQNTMQWNAGSPSSGTYRGVNTTIFQPAMPVPLTEDWTWISRPVFSVLSTPTFDPLDGDWDRTSGVGPIEYETWITSSKPSKLVFGLGGVASIPLSTRDELNSRKYTAGPSMVMVYKEGDWVVGTLAQYQWSFSGSNKRREVSKASIQYFVTWMGLPDHWQLNMSPTITYNRKASGPDAWAVPVGIGVGKMVKFGKLPVKLQLEFQAYPIHPDDSFGPRYAIQFKITPVILALIKDPLF